MWWHPSRDNGNTCKWDVLHSIYCNIEPLLYSLCKPSVATKTFYATFNKRGSSPYWPGRLFLFFLWENLIRYSEAEHMSSVIGTGTCGGEEMRRRLPSITSVGRRIKNPQIRRLRDPHETTFRIAIPYMSNRRINVRWDASIVRSPHVSSHQPLIHPQC